MKPDYQGKVRDIYYIDAQTMLLVVSDRISAFDCIFAEPVAGKGEALTAISSAWFALLKGSGLEQKLGFQDHLISADSADFPEPFRSQPEYSGRSVLVRRTSRIDYECIVRGYLAGSAYKEYVATGQVQGHSLPPGLQAGSALPHPIFTPTTKADNGHDLPVTIATMQADLGELALKLEQVSLAIFELASAKLQKAGLILYDTKFEFGMIGQDLHVIDEILTPDSSRFRDQKDQSTDPLSSTLDKQFLRHFLEQSDWNKEPPPPPLPAEIVLRLQALYAGARERILRAIYQ